MSSWRWLVDDPRTWAAVDQLLDRGLCEEYVFPLLQHLSRIPEMWARLDREAPEDRDDRRRALAHKVRALALEIDADPEARHDRIFDHRAITQGDSSRPMIADFLRGYADTLAERGADALTEPLRGKKTTRNDLRSFVRREVALILETLLPPQETNPVAAATKLASVLLGEVVTDPQMKKTYFRL